MENQFAPFETDALAFTLVEMVLSMAIAGILFLALAGFVGITSQAIPSQNSPMLSVIQGGRVVDRIATEMESALYVSERGANRITFTVADRDGDGKPERIRYAWSGVAGDPLTRQYNGNAPVSIVDKVYLFTLTPGNKAVTQSYLGTGAEDATESLLVDKSANPGGQTQVASNNYAGEYFSPTLPANATGWRPTRVRVMAAMNNSLPGTCSLQLQPANATMTPSSNVLEQYTFSSAGLSIATWLDFPLVTTTVQAPGAGMCAVIAYTSGTGPKITQCGNTSGMVKCNPSQLPVVWQYQNNNSLLFQMYGKVTRPGGTQYVTSRYFTSVGIALQAGSSANPTVRSSSVMLNHPEYLANLYELKFDLAPTVVDANGDGVFDWVVRGGGTIPVGSIAGGNWTTTTTTLDSAAGSDYANVTVIDLRFLSNTASTTPGVSLNALRSGSTCGPLSATLQLQADGTQTLAVTGKTSDGTSKTLLSKPGLSNALHDLRLIIDPATVSVGVVLDTVPIGTYLLPRFASGDGSRALTLLSGGGGQFQYFRVREIDPNP